MAVALLACNVSHLCFLKMWHGRDSNTCAISVREMILSGRGHCYRAQKSSMLSTTPRRRLGYVDGCPGGVYSYMLSYADWSGWYIRGGQFMIYRHNSLRECPFPASANVASGNICQYALPVPIVAKSINLIFKYKQRNLSGMCFTRTKTFRISMLQPSRYYCHVEKAEVTTYILGTNTAYTV